MKSREGRTAGAAGSTVAPGRSGDGPRAAGPPPPSAAGAGEPAGTAGALRGPAREPAPPGVPRRTGRMTKVRWGIVWMCFLGTSINYLDRANLSIAMPKIVDDFGMRIMYTFAVIWWSVFTALTAVASGF